MSGGALAGLEVLDFSTSLPGPLATLMLADAGAHVVKVERPEGEAARADPAVFAILNRGKRSIVLDLKRQAARLSPLIERADILVEQFRPGVMERLGLGYDAMRAVNPRIIYVSINGYGSEGSDATRPGHDLTYAAEAGLLSLNVDSAGGPVMPAALAADVAGGGIGAFGQIMTALYLREKTGCGTRLEVSLFAGLMPFLHEPLAHSGEGRAVTPGYSPATGSSERYGIYLTADRRHLALACPEDKFWANFCKAAGIPLDANRPAVAARLLERTAAEWIATFDQLDLCCSLVASFAEALDTPRIQRLLDRRLSYAGGTRAALPTPLAADWRSTASHATAPALGEGNADLLA